MPESWTMRKSERKKIDAFELWVWRRVLRIPWIARISNRRRTPGSVSGLGLLSGLWRRCLQGQVAQSTPASSSWVVRKSLPLLPMKALRKILAVNLAQPPPCPLARANMSSGGRAKVISYEEIKKLMAEGEAQVFDVRSQEEVANGHIANSVNIPVAEVEEAFRMDPETFKMKYGVNKPQKDEENLVFHCQMGKRGARAAEIAVALGYTKARNYAGGYKEWSEKEGK